LRAAERKGRSALVLSLPCLSTAMSILLKSFAGDECGATAIEYGLIAALIAVFLIGALSALGTNMSSEFAQIGAAMN
jgi:pilus assembly protein Flp/PilA